MKKVWRQALAALLVLILGIGLSWYLIHTRKRPPERPQRRPALVVRTMVAKPQPYTYTVETTGEVVASRVAELAAEVSGKVLWVSPRLLPGRVVRAGEILVRLDPTDYQAAVARAEAELREAERALAELSAEAQRARAEWESLHPQVPPPPLAVKEPELSAARARVSAARKNLQKARADLHRTEIRAPFAGRVLSVSVERGSYLVPGRAVATLYPLEGLEVYAPVADHFLPYLRVPGFNTRGPGSRAAVLWEAGKKVYRYPAQIARLGGKVEEKTRLIPLYLRFTKPPSPPLLPGVFVTIHLWGRTYPSAFRLPAVALHRSRGQTFVWVVEKGRLSRRPVKVLQETEKEVVILGGLSGGEHVVIQRLLGALPGTLVTERP
ncbi:efflux RND transporter periplasmic adaptor subunit [Thermosulfurimonas marina]|uniref:Efflux RND transporter periplasmic adaptor subunit n=1 Tax=Thermosulfurimonas marina TaxID=2047767 RepID=A0A6H1WQ83_9BACT|nr:efflux RND transporter periplasmic adaptor subunit [Thermosulfurimonas marina]QJA05351.1 efflux RND transporter periplasmic adaptor subunit [Thermosulfurimonas marina]